MRGVEEYKISTWQNQRGSSPSPFLLSHLDSALSTQIHSSKYGSKITGIRKLPQPVLFATSSVRLKTSNPNYGVAKSRSRPLTMTSPKSADDRGTGELRFGESACGVKSEEGSKGGGGKGSRTGE